MDLKTIATTAWRSQIFWIIVVGFAIRIVLGYFFTFPYDCGNWAKIAETVVSGEELYDRPDNYYAPIWGYFLSFMASVYLMLGGASFANQFDEYLFLDGFRVSYYNSVMIEPAFGMLLKVSLFIVDLAVAFVIRRIVLDICGDERKATIAFGIWFLCPLVIYCSSIYLIFDTIEVLFLSLCFLAILRERPFIAGGMMLMAGMVKPFAFYLVPLFLVYILMSKTDFRDKVNQFALTAGGFVTMFVLIFLPVLLNGDFSDSLTFLTGRVDSAGTVIDNGIGHIMSVLTNFEYQVFVWLQPIIIPVILIIAYLFYRKGDRSVEMLICYSAISLIIVFLWPVTQQCYYLVLVLFIALMVVKWRASLVAVLMLTLTSLSTIYMVLTHNYSLLLPLAAYTDLVSSDWVIDRLLSFNLMTDVLDGNFYDDSRRAVQVVIIGVMLYLIHVFYRWGVKEHEGP